MYFVYFKKGMFNTMHFFIKRSFITTIILLEICFNNKVLLWKPYSYTSDFQKTFFTNRGAFCENYLKTLDAD